MSAPIVPNDIKQIIPDPTTPLCGNFVSALLKLPVLFYKFINWMLDGDGNVTKEFIAATSQIRPGDLIFSGSASNTSGRLLCDGTAVSRTTYADLFAAIGTTFGPGDGSTTFNLPDYQDNFPVGVSGTKMVGVAGGEATHTLTESELPGHRHFVANVDITNDAGPSITADTIINQGMEEVGGGSERSYQFKGSATEATLGTTGTGTGGGAAHNNLPPYLPCYVWIKT